jgi:hypothetical protein
VIPALADIRTARILAHGVEVELAHEAFESEVTRRSRRTHFQPRGFWRPFRVLTVRTTRHERDDSSH